MPYALLTELIRTIKESFARFLAIVGIVALGCGFYAGLKMTSPDMQEAAHAFYTSQNLYDIRVISTLGLSQKEVDTLAQIKGVGSVMPSRTVDVMATFGSSQSAARVSSLISNQLNQPHIVEGRLPEGPNECVVSADPKKREGMTLGQQIELPDTSSGVHFHGGNYTVVGFVNAPVYPYVSNFGNTSLGNGIVQQYVYVSEQAFDSDDPYTEVYLTVQSAKQYTSGSSEYQAQVDKIVQAIQDMQPSLASMRLQELKEDAQKKIDDMRQKYEDAKIEAQSQLDDAQQKLVEADQQIAENSKKIEEGEKDYRAGSQRLAASQELAEQQFIQAESQIASSEVQISQGLAELNARETQYESGLAALTSAQTAFTQQKTQFENTRDTYISSLAVQGIVVHTLEEAQQQLQALGQPTSQVDALLATQAQLVATESQLISEEQTLSSARIQLDQRRAQLQAAQDQVTQTKVTLIQARNSSAEQLSTVQEKLAKSLTQLQEGQRALTVAREQSNEGRKSFEQKQTEVQEQLAEGQQQIDQAQKTVDSLSEPNIFVLDRTKEAGIAAYQADLERIGAIANVFPLMFFLVAALVSLTSMTRMVSEERTLIGMHKALGYSVVQISIKYLLYAGTASLLGAVIGVALLGQILPAVILSAYGSIYTIPNPGMPYSIHWDSALLAGFSGISITLIVTFIAVLSSLREEPSSLMLPKAPRAGTKILLEHVNFIWLRLSFSWKVTMRNLFRYKRRLIMTVVGIAGCTALILVAYGLQNSIWDVIDKQWPNLSHYDYIVGMKSDITAQETSEITHEFDTAGAEQRHVIKQENALLASATCSPSSETRTTLVTASFLQDVSAVFTLQNRLTGKPIDFSDDSVVITEKLAKILGVQVGDTVQIYEQDQIGNATGEAKELVISDISENYVGAFLYIGSHAWESLGERAQASCAWYARLPDNQQIRKEFSEKIIKQSGVSVVEDINEVIHTYKESLKVVNRVVIILIVAAALLAFIVLYNLTNINIEERIREIASLKVLGFTRHEVDAYVFREIALLVIFGALLGLVLGTYLAGFVIQTAEINFVMFGRTIHTESYFYAFGLTLVFSLLVYVAMRPKLKRIDMVESLKGVE